MSTKKRDLKGFNMAPKTRKMGGGVENQKNGLSNSPNSQD